MFTPVKLGVFGVLSLFSAMVMGGLNGATTYAAETLETTQPSESVSESIPLEIVPICSDAASNTSHWKVTNKNIDDVRIDWDNFEHGLTGTFIAPSGDSSLETDYVPHDPNNTTRFTYQNMVTATNAQVAPCEVVEEPATTCVDGRIQDNLLVTFLSNDMASISTRDGKLLCEDVVVYFSSYIMPGNYNGLGFENNPTAYPQYIHGSVRATLAAGTTGTQVLNVSLPDRCQNVQIDVYYAPEIRQVSSNGHGTQNILSKIIEKAHDCPTGGYGGGGETDPIPTQPAPVTSATPSLPVGGSGSVVEPVAAQLPAELPLTGSTLNPPYMLVGLLLALLTYAFVYRFNSAYTEDS